MLGNISKLLKINFIIMLLLSSVAVAGEIDQGDIPGILLDDCDSSCRINYIDVDTCWGGNIIEMPVHILNEDTLSHIELTLDLPAGYTYEGLDTVGTPADITIDTITIRDVFYMDIDFNAGGELEPSSTYRWLMDIKIKVPTSASFGTTDSIRFEESPRARVKGENLDCIVTGATNALITICAVGDVNGSKTYNGLDITYGVAFFSGGPDAMCPFGSWPIPPCDAFFYCGDVNNSCTYNGLDITYGVAYFKGGASPIPCSDCAPAP